MSELIDALKRRASRPHAWECKCSPVQGMHDPHCPLWDGHPDYALAADAIGVFALIVKESGVRNDKIIEAMQWALENV